MGRKSLPLFYRYSYYIKCQWPSERSDKDTLSKLHPALNNSNIVLMKCSSKYQLVCNFTTECYLKKIISRQDRSVLAQFRSENLPLYIETGRWQSKPIEERLLFSMQCMNNWRRILLSVWVSYSNLRNDLFISITRSYQDFEYLSLGEKFRYMLKHENICIKTAKFLVNALITEKRLCIKVNAINCKVDVIRLFAAAVYICILYSFRLDIRPLWLGSIDIVMIVTL